MRDYYYIWDNGDRTAVADLPTYELHDILQNGVQIHTVETPSDCAAAVIERVQLEIFIRNNGLRT